MSAIRLLELCRLGQGALTALEPDGLARPGRAVLSGRQLTVVEKVQVSSSSTPLSLSASATLSQSGGMGSGGQEESSAPRPSSAATSLSSSSGLSTSDSVSSPSRSKSSKRSKRDKSSGGESTSSAGESKSSSKKESRSPKKRSKGDRSTATPADSGDAPKSALKGTVPEEQPKPASAADSTESTQAYFSVIGLESGVGGAPSPIALRKPVQCDAVLVHPTKPIVAVRLGGVIQVFDVVARARVGSLQLTSSISHWSWVRGGTALGIVDDRAVHVWGNLVDTDAIEPDALQTVFGRPERFRGDIWTVTQLSTNASGTWTILGGVRRDQRRDCVVGMLVLYNSDKGVSQCLDATAGQFASRIRVHSNDREPARDMVVFASPDNRLMCVSIDDEARLTFSGLIPPSRDPDDGDFPVGVEIDSDLGLVFLITKLGRLVVFVLVSDGAKSGVHVIFDDHVSADPVFSTSNYGASSVRPPGLCALNRAGQLFYITADVYGLLDSVRETPEVQLVLQRRLSACLSKRPQLTLPRPVAAPSPKPLARSDSMSSMSRPPPSSGDAAEPRSVAVGADAEKPAPPSASEPVAVAAAAVVVTPADDASKEVPLSVNLSFPDMADSNPFLPTKELPRGPEGGSPGVSLSSSANPFEIHVQAAPAQVAEVNAQSDALDKVFADAPARASIVPEDRWLECLETEEYVEAAKLALSPGNEVLRSKEMIEDASPSIGYYASLISELSRPESGPSAFLSEAEALALIRPTLFLGKQGVAQIRTWWTEQHIPALPSVADAISISDRALAAEILSQSSDKRAQERALDLLSAGRRAARHQRGGSAAVDAKVVTKVLLESESSRLDPSKVAHGLQSILRHLHVPKEGQARAEYYADFCSAATATLAKDLISPVALCRLAVIRTSQQPPIPFELLSALIQDIIFAAARGKVEAGDVSGGVALVVPTVLTVAPFDREVAHRVKEFVASHGTARDAAVTCSTLASLGQEELAFEWLLENLADASCREVLNKLIQRNPLFAWKTSTPEDFLGAAIGSASPVTALNMISPSSHLPVEVAPKVLESVLARDWSNDAKSLEDAFLVSNQTRTAFLRFALAKSAEDPTSSHIESLLRFSVALDHGQFNHFNHADDLSGLAKVCHALVSAPSPLISKLSFGETPPMRSPWLAAFSLAWKHAWFEELNEVARGLTTEASKSRLASFVVSLWVCFGRSSSAGRWVETILSACTGTEEMISFCVNAGRWVSLARLLSDSSDVKALTPVIADQMRAHKVRYADLREFLSSCDEAGCDRSTSDWETTFPRDGDFAGSMREYADVASEIHDLLKESQATAALALAMSRDAVLTVARELERFADQSSLFDSLSAHLSASSHEAMLLADAYALNGSEVWYSATVLSSVLKTMVSADCPNAVVKLLRSVLARSRSVHVSTPSCIPPGVGDSSSLHNLLLLTALSSTAAQSDEEMFDLIELCENADHKNVSTHFRESGKPELAAHLLACGGRFAEAVDLLWDLEEKRDSLVEALCAKHPEARARLHELRKSSSIL